MISALTLTLSASGASAQPTAPAVNVLWELVALGGLDPNGGPQTQDGSGESWFYSITPSVTATGVEDGFVAAGYSIYPGVSSTPGCTSDCDEGCAFAALARIGPGGEVEWLQDAGIEGTFFRVINTSDGGFLAVGHTHDRDLVGTTPSTPPLAGAPGSSSTAGRPRRSGRLSTPATPIPVRAGSCSRRSTTTAARWNGGIRTAGWAIRMNTSRTLRTLSRRGTTRPGTWLSARTAGSASSATPWIRPRT